ncbi:MULTISPECIES: TetR/AcrR family transcriptional regulator [Thermomonospora]|uniref:Transcriptional regulator, TetR family n=1 Tax=Thermomonospora curvata (strain ATCC 19995 / DSM 43183 / JCM 3096 / KCTC 9072 / NBRC 15933 / NCIMB 10081 / Henssen B9) TaxID=471852 RepID=D1A898_THECD|nr:MULTISPECIES: TetR family transcriptional regulator [Thermomonospora]ACZ00413.1 transcriptional regulator, TetR family [Thermomonospora curvata DSM 43183]PKK11796.1 MAG: TetR/AcrR family transcriptional regulator [Thermomonospora sp. CIF 1]
MTETRSAKSEQTRALIVETALRLFRERGYEATTMRAIAKEAGVSVGNAYYYFGSKEELLQTYYDELQEAHMAACRAVLEREREFAPRLLGVLKARIDTMVPYHQFAGKFFKFAAEPTSPLNPFSAESGPARAAAIAIYREVVNGSTLKIDPDFREELPELLWLYSMGIVLYWVHDSSPGCRKTYLLVERTVPLVDKMVSMSRLPGFKSVTRELVGIIRDVRA